MADLKISQLPVATTPLAGTELVPIVQGGTTDQTTVQAILTSAVPSGTANGVLYLNGSKVVTSGSALTFDGTNFTTTGYAAGNGIRSLGGNAVRFYNSANSNFSQITAPAGTGNMQFDTGAGEQMRLTSTGLGIGTSSPVGKLDTRGTAYLGSDSNNSLVVDSTSSLVTIAAAGRTAFSTSALRFLTSDGTAALERARIDSAGNVVVGTAALATSATDGFLYVPTCAGTPTGTPTTYTGTAPIVVNTTNNKLYFYSGGAWRDAGP